MAALPASSVLVQLLLWFCHRAGVGDVSLQCGPCIKWPLLVCIHILDLRANSCPPRFFPALQVLLAPEGDTCLNTSLSCPCWESLPPPQSCRFSFSYLSVSFTVYRYTEQTCHSVYAEVRKQLVGVDSFCLLRGSWKLTSDDQAWR